MNMLMTRPRWIIDDLARPQLVRFSDGTESRLAVRLYQGACNTGDPTAYTIRDGQTIWLRPTAFGFEQAD